MAIYTFDFESRIMNEIDQASRKNSIRPFWFGDVSGPDGGVTNGPVPIIGKLSQRRIAYDSTESCSSGISASGGTLVNNLNRIRGGYAICDQAILPRHLSFDIMDKFHPGPVSVVAKVGGDYTTIQPAIDYIHSVGGGAVIIYPGVYEENIVLYHGTFILGMAGATIYGIAGGPIITAPASGACAVENMYIIKQYGSEPTIIFPTGSTASVDFLRSRIINPSGYAAYSTGNTAIFQSHESYHISASGITGMSYALIDAGEVSSNIQATTIIVKNLPKLTGTITGSFNGLYQNTNGEIVGPSFTFDTLSDVPNTYASEKFKILRVKSDETGLEFVTASGGGANQFTDLSDVPASYTGGSLKFVRVKSDETGLEFTTASGILPHNLLGAYHDDTTANSPVLGDLIVAQGSPVTWKRLAITVPSAGIIDFLGTVNGDTIPAYKAASSNPGAAAAILATSSTGGLSISGIFSVLNTTDSSSPSTGSSVFNGGVGIAKNLYVGVNVDITGTLAVRGASMNLSTANPTYLANRLVATTGTNCVGSSYENTGGRFFVGRDNSTSGSVTGSGRAYDAYIWMEDNHSLAFGTNNASRMVIANDGAISLATKITTYNNVATEGYGVGSIVDDVALTNQSADIGSTNFTNAGTAGTYAVFYYICVTTTDAGAGSVNLQIAHNNGTATLYDNATALSLATASRVSGVFMVKLGSGSVSYNTTHTGSYGTSKYALYMSCMRLS